MKRILVVDDDADIVELVKNRLEDNNYEVIFANSGDEGIRKAQHNKLDLIIMDIMMPEMSGGDAVRVLRSSKDTKNIPILFLTAVTSAIPQGNEFKGVNVDGEFYTAVAKPFTSEKLLLEVNKMLSI